MDTLKNHSAIFEILSPSTRDYDWKKAFLLYADGIAEEIYYY